MDAKKLAEEIKQGMASAAEALKQGSDEGPVSGSYVVTAKNLDAFVSACAANIAMGLACRTADER